jgi:DNA-binding transcriptional MerR regulator
MSNKKFKPPSEIAGKTYLSKATGKFSKTPQRTVQAWTERGLIVSETTGTGDRRRYTVLNCIEVGVIASLAEDRVSFKIIDQVMCELRKGTPLTLEQALGDNRAFLIIRFYESQKIGVTCVSNERFGPRSGFGGEKRDFKTFWVDTTVPEDEQHIKTLVIDLSYIQRKIVGQMLKEA